MADRYPTYFGPIVEVDPDAPPAFSAAALVRIQAERIAADLAIVKAAPAFPERLRFACIPPAAGAAPRAAVVDGSDAVPESQR